MRKLGPKEAVVAAAICTGAATLLPWEQEDEVIALLLIIGLVIAATVRDARAIASLAAGGALGRLVVGAPTVGDGPGPIALEALVLGTVSLALVYAAIGYACFGVLRLVHRFGGAPARDGRSAEPWPGWVTGPSGAVGPSADDSPDPGPDDLPSPIGPPAPPNRLAGMATPVVGPTARLPPVGGLARYLLVLAGIAALALVTVVAIGGLSVPGAQLRSGSALLDGCGETLTHQAPDVEAVLPSALAGRTLSVWSVRGECWLWLVTGDTSHYEQLLGIAQERSIDLDDLRYGIAGRRDVDADPPFFVFGITDPADPAAREFAIDLLIAGASFVDNYGTGPDTFVPRTIAGREVKVGTAAMIGQSEHIRGLPYLVEADGFSFVVVTDDPDWAEEAIAALPD